MFLNPSATINNVISNVNLTTQNNELYENGIRIATQTDIDFLQQEINSFIPDNPNGWINSDGITTNGNRIPFTDGSPNGMTTTQSLTFVIDSQNNPTLTVGGTQMISINNNMYLRSAGEISTNMDLKLEGDPNFQRALQIKNMSQPNYVKTYVDNTTSDFICDNQIGSKNEWIGATGYYFDNTIYVNNEPLDISGLIQDVSQNTTDISQNKLDISQNTYDISQNTADIATINSNLKQNLYNYYVSAQSGSDVSGNGSIMNPWQTIGKAVTVLNAVVGDITSVINVASGQYSETDIIVTKSGVSIIGANSISTIFTGDIYFNMAVSSLFYSVGQLANISVYGCIYHANLHLYSNSLSISGIISAPPNGKSCIIISGGGGGLGGDCSITNNSILYANSDTVPIVLNQNASLTGVGFQIQNNPSLSFTLQSYISVLDNARCNLFGCSLINSSNNANVGALIDIYNTNNVTSSSTINNCIFLYPAGVATTTGAIINFRNTASSNTVNFYNNFCRCFLTQNAPNNYIVLKSGGGAVNFSQAQNIGRSPQHHIPATGAFAGWTKTTYPTVI
jgi:hypothetical protein